MPQSNPHRWPTRRFIIAAHCGNSIPDILRKRMGLPPLNDTDLPIGPLAPAELRAEPPGPDGVRHGLVAFYRDLIARGELDSPERFAAAEDRLLDTLTEPR
ncbi:MAG: hypothetical protein ACRC8S_09530 [Fimbriiglobus sp.]